MTRTGMAETRRRALIGAALQEISARGSLDFDLPEARVLLDEDDPRRVRDVVKSRSLPEVKEAYRIVEDFMLAANEAVARFFKERELPTLWRVHAPPSEERLAEFAALAQSFGIPFTIEEGRSPRGMRDFLGRIVGKPMERSLSYLLLRALKQAVYDVANVGHFGLAAPEYLHFTSPIRRYADLAVHRIVKRYLHGERGLSVEDPAIETLSVHINARARAAARAENDRRRMLTAAYMANHIGEVHDARVTSVRPFGLLAQLDGSLIEGSVPWDAIPGGPYEIDAGEAHARSASRTFAIGGALRVKVVATDPALGRITLGLVEE